MLASPDCDIDLASSDILGELPTNTSQFHRMRRAEVYGGVSPAHYWRTKGTSRYGG